MKAFIAMYLFVGTMFGTGAATSTTVDGSTISHRATVYVVMSLMWPSVVVRWARDSYDQNNL